MPTITLTHFGNLSEQIVAACPREQPSERHDSAGGWNYRNTSSPLPPPAAARRRSQRPVAARRFTARKTLIRWPVRGRFDDGPPLALSSESCVGFDGAAERHGRRQQNVPQVSGEHCGEPRGGTAVSQTEIAGRLRGPPAASRPGVAGRGGGSTLGCHGAADGDSRSAGHGWQRPAALFHDWPAARSARSRLVPPAPPAIARARASAQTGRLPIVSPVLAIQVSAGAAAGSPCLLRFLFPVIADLVRSDAPPRFGALADRLPDAARKQSAAETVLCTAGGCLPVERASRQVRRCVTRRVKWTEHYQSRPARHSGVARVNASQSPLRSRTVGLNAECSLTGAPGRHRAQCPVILLCRTGCRTQSLSIAHVSIPHPASRAAHAERRLSRFSHASMPCRASGVNIRRIAASGPRL